MAVASTPISAGGAGRDSLRQAQRLLQEIADNTQAAVFAKDLDGRYLLINDTAARVLHAAPDRVIGRLDRDFMPEDAAERIRANDLEVARRRRREEYEESIVVEGRTRVFLAAKFPLLDDDGNVFGVGGISTDITERQAAENAATEAIRRLDAVARITDIATTFLDLDRMFEALLPALAEVFGADAAVVLLREGERLEVRATHGLETEDRAEFVLAIGEGFGGTIAETRRPLYLPDVLTSDLVRGTWVYRTRIRTMLGVPLLRGTELIGVLHVDWLTLHDYEAREEQLLGLLGDRIALAISNAQLFGEQRRATRLAEALNSVNELLLRVPLNVDEMLSSVVSIVADAMGADRCLLIEPDRDGWFITHTHNMPPEVVGTQLNPQNVKATEVAVLVRQPAFAEDAVRGPVSAQLFARRYGIAAYAFLPLFAHAEPAGALIAAYDRPRQFRPHDRYLATRLSTAVSLAIESARMSESEHRVASILQESLLAMPESVPGIEFDCVYRSASQAARVGGDFFDLFEIEGDRVGVLIGDVSGKGLDAAVLTSLVKNTIRAYASDGRHGPASVVSRANKAIERSSTSEVFVTVFFGVLERDRRGFRYCNAGHTTGFLARASSGTVELMQPNSPLVGAFNHFEFFDERCDLGGEDTIVLYTDGLLEARRGAEFYGEQRLFDFVSSLHETPTIMARSLVDEVARFTDQGLSDDVAVLVFRVEARPSEVVPEFPFL